MNDLDLLERFRASVTEPSEERVAAARARLHAAYADASNGAEGSRLTARRSPARRHRAVLAALASVPAVAVLAVLLAGALGGHATSVADAAIIHRADAALTPPPDQILHVKVQGDGFVSESWRLTSAPYSGLAYKAPVGAPQVESAADGSTVSWYDPTTNTINVAPINVVPATKGGAAAFDSPLVAVREALANGQARVLGTAIVDRVQTYEIQFAGKGGFDSRSPIAYVDQSTYKPVELMEPQADGGIARLQVVALEYLPATPANMRLLSLEDRHPGAQVVRGVSSPLTGGKRSAPAVLRRSP